MSLLRERELDFLLYEFLNTESLLSRPRYQEHSRETFNATLQTAQTVAEKFFAPHYQTADAQEPHFDGNKVTMLSDTKAAWDAFAEAGFLAAHHDFEHDGMQLPEVIMRTALAYFSSANIATAGYPFLTIGAANLLKSFGTEAQKARYLPLMLDGRAAGTMALTEPNQGSALADIKTTAVLHDDGSYRITGNKMYISGGDNALTENIFHMVLARIQGAPAGAGGISLFLVPKFLLTDEGETGERNDVHLAGLLHKMGFRNTTSTLLNFGEQGGAIGFLIGEPHKGLKYMFQLMNEARIGVAAGAAVLAYNGFSYSLNYARERPQGRHPSNKDPLSPQVNIIEHADVRRLLLAQKAFAEGGLALCLYASSLFEDQQTASTEEARKQAFLRLDLITPMVKSWPSKYGLMANDMAIQVLGGAGYMREYPVEQYYRDNRLNPIHEGTEAIHGIDLLGRKLAQAGGAGFEMLLRDMRDTVAEAGRQTRLVKMADQLGSALDKLQTASQMLINQLSKNPNLTLANATLYLDAFGCVLVSWIWLRQAQIAEKALQQSPSEADANFYRGKLQAAEYYLTWELPKTDLGLHLAATRNPTCYDMHDDWF